MKFKTADSSELKKAGKLQIARAEAIEAYARLEHSMCFLFGYLLGGGCVAAFPKASAVFFNITSARNRNKALEKLLELEHGNKYDIFWYGEGKPGGIGGLFKLIKQLDQSRNEIIHWSVSRTLSTTDFDAQMEKLVPGEIFAYSPNGRSISIDELNDFVKKANFVVGSIMAFSSTSEKTIPDAVRDPWLPIFQSPVAYPPPSNHPLSQTDKAP